jgi:hypothetical protein
VSSMSRAAVLSIDMRRGAGMLSICCGAFIARCPHHRLPHPSETVTTGGQADIPLTRECAAVNTKANIEMDQ